MKHRGVFVAPLTDEDRLRAYKDALSNWEMTGYVCFELLDRAHKWLRTEFDGVTTKEFARLMCEYVSSGGDIDEVPETRHEWSSDYEFHYDLSFNIQGKPIYVETRLNHRLPVKPDDSSIVVVNVH